MAMQQVEYEFPDPDKTEGKEIEVEIKEETEDIEVEGAIGREEIKKPKKEPTEVKVVQEEAEEVEVEVVNDTPEADRGRKPSQPPEEVTAEELGQYSDKVKKRIKHFSKGYHDERRAKEQATREKEEAILYAQKILAENKKLKVSADSNHNTLIESAKQQVELELARAKEKYQQAYEGGQSSEMVEAQEALNAAQIRADKVNSLKKRALPPSRENDYKAAAPQTSLQTPESTKESQPELPKIQRDPQAVAWADKNSWFGSDDEMTAFALGLHTKLTKEGINPQSVEYYERIDGRMREVFPHEFDDGIDDKSQEPQKKSSNVVAPATRSTAPNKIRLSQTQIALAKRLGVSLEDYAKQAAQLMRAQN